ncbi:hypothetical protein OB920_13225 [Halobacteria archaeon HArc-gm2]|nr:hypothetical protein [Halobacteria archaeon HArc-gm2]
MTTHIDHAFGPHRTPRYELGAEFVCDSTETRWLVRRRYWNPDADNPSHSWEYALISEELNETQVSGFDLSVNYSRTGHEEGDSDV